MIATNKDDMEPDIETVNDYTSVYVMTVHKSKGLEFDTVILPAMSADIEPGERTTIMTENNKVAWIYKKDELNMQGCKQIKAKNSLHNMSKYSIM